MYLLHNNNLTIETKLKINNMQLQQNYNTYTIMIIIK